jgi:hypothetical protein
MIKYGSLSPYSKTNQTVWYLDIYVPKTILRDGTDKEYVIPNEYHKRPDLCAYFLYNNPRYKFVFAMLNMNEIKDPINDFTSGKTIYIPTIEKIKKVYG